MIGGWIVDCDVQQEQEQERGDGRKDVDRTRRRTEVGGRRVVERSCCVYIVVEK